MEKYWQRPSKKAILNIEIRSEGGQRFLRELRTALDSMKDKELISRLFERDSYVCAIGCICKAKSINPNNGINRLRALFNVSCSLLSEIVTRNDDLCDFLTLGFLTSQHIREVRWRRVRDWVESRITKNE